jgi:hypothetical protein
MQLKEALDRIHQIRDHLDRTEVFCGYRSVPVAASGLLALAAAFLQPRLVPAPAETPLSWLALWLVTAVVSVGACGAEMGWRYRRTDSSLERERIGRAVGLFLPAVSAGALVTLAAAVATREALPLLPGLWAVFMGVGVFASLPMLPRAVAGVGGFYLFAGIAVLVLARGDHAFSPLAMGLVFGIGQLAGAAVLRLTLERRRDGS